MSPSIWEQEGLPSYQHFRSLATFMPELADFALTQRQCGRVLADYGIDMLAGQGLGDLQLLYQSVSKKGHITYDGLSQIFKVTKERQKRVQARVQAEQQQQAAAAAAAPQASSRAVKGPMTGLQDDKAHAPLPHTPHHAPAAPPGPLTGSAKLAELLKPAGTSTPAAAAAAGSGGPPARPWAAPRHPGAQAADGPAGPGPSSLRLSADTLSGAGVPSAPLTGMAALMAIRDPPRIVREVIPVPPCEFAPVRSQIKGLSQLVLGSEVARALGAVKDVYKEWEAAMEEKAMKDEVRRSRSKAASEEAEAAAAARGPRPPAEVPLEGTLYLLLMAGCCSLSSGSFAVARRVLTAAESQFNSKLLGVEHPYHYCIFLCQGLVHYYEGEFEKAIDKFETAYDLADLVARDKSDPTARRNAACCLNNMGVCSQLLGRRSEAVGRYRAAVDSLKNSCGLLAPVAEVALSNLNKTLRHSFAMGDLRPRTTPPPPTLRPLSTSTGPVGTAALKKPAARPMSAAASIRPASAGSGGPAGLLARHQLQQAGGFGAAPPAVSASLDSGAAGLRPAGMSAEGMPLAMQSGANEKLQVFLRQAITMRESGPLSSLPKWAQRSTGVDAAAKKKKPTAKEKDKKKDAKGKGAPKKKKVRKFEITYPMDYYDMPSYGVANVQLEKKKGKKKAA